MVFAVDDPGDIGAETTQTTRRQLISSSYVGVQHIDGRTGRRARARDRHRDDDRRIVSKQDNEHERYWRVRPGHFERVGRAMVLNSRAKTQPKRRIGHSVLREPLPM